MITSTNYGALPGDWFHFSSILDLATEIIPVVSNPNAVIASYSALKAIGKTPSTFDANRQVVGIAGWPVKLTTDAEIEQWSSDPDLGICLRMRQTKALDIDIEDPAQAAAVEEVITKLLGKLPRRHRANSSKSAFIFRLSEGLSKRVITTSEGIIEFLGDKQQLVVSATHTSGARYEWDGGLPANLPEITVDQLDACWDALKSLFAVSFQDGFGVTDRQQGDTLSIDDPVKDWLEATGRVLSVDRAGSLNIECPWDDEHSSGAPNDGSTVWFPAGTRAYPTGSFKCLHAHCEQRDTIEFLDAVGMPQESVIDMFDVVALVPMPGGGIEREQPNFSRTRDGAIKSTLDNVRMAIERIDVCHMDIAYDNFKDELVVRVGGDEWRNFTDEDNTALRLILEQGGFLPIGAELVRDVVRMVAKQKEFDSAIDWAESLVWDGVSRVEMFNHTHLGAEDTPYTRAVAMYTWTAMAGRCLVPGIKADICPIWETPTQGEGKSTGIKAMVPRPEMFSEMSLHETEENIARKMRGKLLGELAEMDGLKSREVESTKKMLSSVGANIVPKYKEHAVLVLRRFILIGTTNENEILFDTSGNRRLAPFRIRRANLKMIEMDRTQLWAEAVVIFKKLGVCFQGVEEHMAPEHEKFRAIDSWENDIADWLNLNNSIDGEYPRNCEILTTGKILQKALHFSPDRIKRADEMRAGKVMKVLGFENVRISDDSGRKHVWRKV